MVAEVDIANRAMSLLGTRTSIVSLDEGSPESTAANTWLESLRDQLVRLAPWGFCHNYQILSLVCAAPGTPENPTAGTPTWTKGTPPPPWLYEYAQPSDCLKALWIVPQFMTGYTGSVPLTSAVTGGAPNYWAGAPVKFKIAIDQIDQTTGRPSNQGSDIKVILTNQEAAILAYNKRVTDPNIMDDLFQYAWAAALAGRMVMQLTGDKGLANARLQDANQAILQARAADGNEGLTINDVTPDWMRARGVYYGGDADMRNMQSVDWGNLLTTY